MNRVKIRQGNGKTLYEIWIGHASLVKYFIIFESKCYMKREDGIGKFDARNDEDMFLGYSLKSKSYIYFNPRTKTTVESANVRVDENFGIQERILDYDSDEETKLKANQENVELFYEIDIDLQNDIQLVEQREELSEPRAEVRVETKILNKNLIKNNPTDHIISSKDKGVMTRNKAQREELCQISQVEPKSTDEASKDYFWIQAMREELDQIENNDRWQLIPRPKDKNIIGTKWVFRNWMNEQGEIVRNKEKLVCKGYSQHEGIDYEETFAPIAIIEASRMVLAYVANNKFKVYQMNVKLSFLNGEFEEEVYIEHPEGSPLTKEGDMVCN